MKKLFYLIIFSIYFQAYSQPTFEKRIGGEGYQDGMTICKTSDGGFAIAGSIVVDTTMYLDIIIQKTDSLGDSLWTRVYGAPGGNDFPSAITETYDGGLLISATTYALSSQAPSFSDWWIIRTDANGDTLWTKMIRKTGNDRMWHISENDDHTILCCGWLSIGGWAKGTLMKLSETGDSLWSVQIGSAGNSYAQYCKQNYDGNYLVAGGSLSGTFYGVVQEYDTAGNFITGHSYDKAGTAEIINTVDHLPQGGYLISAKTGTVNGYDIWIIRTNELWDTLWTRTFNDPINLYDTEAKFAFDVVADSGCIFGGGDFGTIDMEAVLYRIDSSGTLQWTRFFGDAGDDKANALLSLDDGGFIFSGYAGLSSNIICDIYLVRTDAAGNVSMINSVSETDFVNRFELYPNPTNGKVFWSTNLNSIQEIRIRDFMGKLIQIINSPMSQGSMDLKNPITGMYFFEIISTTGSIRKKILIY